MLEIMGNLESLVPHSWRLRRLIEWWELGFKAHVSFIRSACSLCMFLAKQHPSRASTQSAPVSHTHASSTRTTSTNTVRYVDRGIGRLGTQQQQRHSSNKRDKRQEAETETVGNGLASLQVSPPSDEFPTLCAEPPLSLLTLSVSSL